jgi:hypothetical protein
MSPSLPERATVKDLRDILERSDRIVREYIHDAGIKQDAKGRYLVAPLLEEKRAREARTMHPGAGNSELLDPVTWSDELKAKQVEKLDVQIAELRGLLWSRDDVLSSISEYNARLRGRLENWRQSTGAKDGTPEGKRLIDELADGLIGELYDEFRP